MVIEITQRKIATLAPTWSIFRGSSILFEILGPQRTSRNNNGCDLFADLAMRASQLSSDPWRSQYGFCALPPESYHVTLADLVNDSNFHQVQLPARWQFGRDKITAGKEYPLLLAQAVARSQLMSICKIDFRIDDVIVMNESVLGVRLKPAYPEEFLPLVTARNHLTRILFDEFSIKLQDYSPHITLGYFANKSCARMADNAVKALAAELLSGAGSRDYVFTRPSPFRFSSMAHFVRILNEQGA